MSGFKIIEGEYVIVSQGGVYKQVAVAVRNGYLFAATSGGYVRLYSNGGTSKDKLRFDEMSWEGVLYADKLGKLTDGTPPNSAPLDKPTAQKLLG